MTWAAADLVAALRRQVSELEADLRARVDGDDHDLRQPGVYEAWQRDYDAAFAAQRTASSWQQWRNDRVTQAAVAWVLLTVFARYCEDNGLVTPHWIGGATSDERGHALDARRAYFQQHPEHTDREWLQQIISHFGKFTATKGLVDKYSPLHLVAPSGDAARTLLEFWWQQSATGEPLYPFVGVDTRFLGDVYQDLSEHAKKTYALLQTPEFVEEFILDQTMEPALADRPLEGFTVIDPTCGSGHFLLGAFRRLHERWQRHAPGLGARELVEKALDGVFGVDINPFAVAIARFRLLVAALHAAGDSSIEEQIRYTPHLAAGDSLLWGANQQLLPEDLLAGPVIRADSTENADALKEILQREHDVVVGNPPYVNPRDRSARNTYRQLYKSVHGKYALTVPFMELFFRLAYASGRRRPAGWVGQITSNAFMKRDYGEKLIQDFLPTVDLRIIIDSEGAWIPGHNSDGTPTVIIAGRNQVPHSPTILVVLSNGLRETKAAVPSEYWQSIVGHLAQSGYTDKWITVANVDRSLFATHPWSLSGGGALDTLTALETVSSSILEQRATTGIYAVIGVEEPYELSTWSCARKKSMVDGDGVRDYRLSSYDAYWPYRIDGSPEVPPPRSLWPFRTTVRNYVWFDKTKDERGQFWTEYGHIQRITGGSGLLLAFAEVATHNHFVISRGGKVFKQTAPVITLPKGASVEDHLGLLGILNSSVACFWLRQNCKPKGGAADQTWLRTYQFSSNRVKRFPLPDKTPLERAKLLDELAQALQQQTPVEVAARQTPTHAVLESARSEFTRLRGLMIAHQEELDWEYYRIYGLIDEDLTYGGGVPEIALGERAFEIALARRMKDGEETAWFERHGSTPLTEIPEHLPADYRDLLQRRLDAIDSNPHIRLLERPEYKRRWAMEPWDKQVQAALKDWLLDRVEDRALWYDREGRPTVLSVAQLADILDRNEEFRRVLRLWAGDQNVPTGAALAKLLADEAVPFLAAYRYKPSGLDKRAAWEHTWALQRREDAGEKIDAPIPVPPKYTSADFAKPSYWSHRGKLDVPKERFISYPNAGRESDTTELLGWAGWDHADQALALAALISQRIEDGWDTPRLIPLLAGLHELLPWVRQWHNEIDPEYGESVADTIDDELTARLAEHHLTVTDLTAWRPEPTRRTRRAATS